MRPLVEIGRFVVTATAVALAIPTCLALVSIVSGENFSLEAFAAIGAISFAMSLVGGVIVGLPALWLAKRSNWDQDLRKLAPFGCVMGAMGGLLLNMVFWQGNMLIVMAGLFAWALMGAVAGLVSTGVWFCLHAGDRQQAAHD